MKTAGAVILVTTAFLSACSSISVTTDWDPRVNFSEFATYYWIDAANGEANTITEARIKSAVDTAMESRGYRRVESGADLAISYQVTTTQRRSYSTVNTGWGGGWGWHGGWGRMGMSQTVENTWDVGTLVLGLFESGSKDLIWTGSATTDLNDRASPEQRQKQINEAVQKMMKDFPPGT